MRLLLFRFLKLFIISIVSSLPFLVLQVVNIQIGIILLISFLIFLALTGYDAYYFRFEYFEKWDYLKGMIIPYLLLFGACLFTFFKGISVLFNTLFLPFRFAECFGLKTLLSVIVVFVFLLVITSVLALLGEHEVTSFLESVRYEEELSGKAVIKIKNPKNTIIAIKPTIIQGFPSIFPN